MQPVVEKGFRKDINGLRAVAVAAVLLFHFSIPPFRGGFVGVDVFFVISGFLMTEIIAKGLGRGTLSIPDFYLRRLLRILPALALMVAVLLAVGAVVLLPEAFQRLSKDSAHALSFLVNFRFAQDTGYFGDNPSTSWLLHCWSLAVEFQFYILYPVAAWLAWRVGRKVGLVVLLVATVAIALPYSYFETARNQMAAFYLLPARTWEFALGGLVALSPAAPRVLARFIVWLGLAMVALAVLWFDHTWLYPSMWPLLPVAGTALVIWANTSNRLLDSDGFQFLGRISYSLYLWHWPIICVARYAGIVETPLVILVLASLAILAGWLSYAYFENRFRGWNPDTRLRSFVLLAGSALVISGVGLLLGTDRMNRLRVPADINDLVSASQHVNQFRDNVCFLNPEQQFSDLAPECTAVTDPAKPTLLIWGDSHAAQLYPGIVSQPWSRKFNVQQITASACPPIQLTDFAARPFCPDIERQALEYVKRTKPHAVLLAGGVLGLEGDPNDARRDADKAPKFVTLLQELKQSGVAEIYVMGRLPKWRIALPQLVYIRNRAHVHHLHDRARIANADSMPSEDRVLRAITEAAGGKYISIGDVNCVNGDCLTLVPTQSGRALTQFDTEHFTSQGAEWLASRAIGPALGFPAGQRLEVALDETVTFQEGAKGTQLLESGWMPPEGWGTWTIRQDQPGLMIVPVPAGTRPRAIKLTFWGQLAPVFPKERFAVDINGQVHKDMEVTLEQPIRTETYELTPEVQSKIAETGMLRLEFMAPEGRSSKSMGLNQDDRVLGFGIRELTLLK